MENKILTLRSKLNRIQIDLKAPKNLYNSFGKYKYRNVEGIQEAVKPLLKEYAVTLELSDEIVEVGGRVYVKATATLTDCNTNNGGDFDSISVSAFAREADNKKGMDDAQVTGATSSYARKYALNGLFLLDDTKDVDTEEYQAQSKRGTKAKAEPKNNNDLPFEIETDSKPKSYREQLRDFCQENFYDQKAIIQICGLNENSTEDDFKAALDYAKHTMGSES